jgi:phospholipase/carboxylesterase
LVANGASFYDAFSKCFLYLPPLRSCLGLQGLDEARTNLKQLVQECCEMCSLPLDRVVLAGFSQGAMTAMDLALSVEGSVAGVVMLSGAPIVIEEWAKELAKRPKGLPVFISHGQNDQVLPFAASGWSKDLLTNGGAAVDYHPHTGGHDMGSGTLPKLVEFLSRL